MEITAWTAVATNNAIEEVCGVRAGIKWVNDLVIDRKKICGILTEMSVESESGYIQYLIIGIGINVNGQAEDFPRMCGTLQPPWQWKQGKPIPAQRLPPH